MLDQSSGIIIICDPIHKPLLQPLRLSVCAGTQRKGATITVQGSHPQVIGAKYDRQLLNDMPKKENRGDKAAVPERKTRIEGKPVI